MTSKLEFYRNLPGKRMAAGVLLFNSDGEILLVQPTYKDTWEIPGGVVEHNESPKAAVVREVREELSLDLSSQELPLILLDYMAAGKEKTESLMFVFAGPVLSASQESVLSPFLEEIKSFDFFHPDDGAKLLAPVLASRVLRAFVALTKQRFLYAEGSY